MANVAADKHRTTVILPRVLKAEVDQYSEKTGAPLSEIFRRALAMYLKSHETKEVA